MTNEERRSLRARFKGIDQEHQDLSFLSLHDVSKTYSEPSMFTENLLDEPEEMESESEEPLLTLTQEPLAKIIKDVFTNINLWISFSIYLLISLGTFYLIYLNVEAPYMDEIFHIPQAQQYCQNQYLNYDAKLTTPPGLYLLSQPLSYFVGCSSNSLRLGNVILGSFQFWVIALVLRSVRNGINANTLSYKHEPFPISWTLALNTLTISVFPIGFFYHHLYYTDTASSFFILTMLLLANHRYYWTSALLGLVSLTFRQTNIAYVVLAMVYSLAWELCFLSQKIIRPTPLPKLLLSPPNEPLDLVELIHSTGLITQVFIANFASLFFKLVLPYGLVMFLFASFLAWNGGIVLGDKSNHVAAIHFPQLMYLLAFSTALAWPHLFRPFNLSSPFKIVSSFLCSLTRPRTALSIIVATIAFILIAQNFTIHHPFLLSDNRHISFYLWKLLFKTNIYHPYLYAPLYTVMAYIWSTQIFHISTQPLILWLGYLAVLVLTLVPSPLLELRYFILPYLVLRLYLIPTPYSSRPLIFELTTYLVLHTLIMYLFIYKTFSWASEPGAVQRFMW